MKRVRGAVLLGACVTLAACGRSDANRVDTGVAGGDVRSDTASAVAGSGATGAAGATNTVKSEADIMAAIRTANAGEIGAADLAIKKAVDPEVKAFARMMKTDHTAMSREGQAVAKSLNVAGAQGDDKADDMRDDVNDDSKDLRDATGRDFDKKYMDLQVNAHEKTLSMLNEVKDDTQNAEIVSLVNGAIPKVQAHLDRAKALKDKVNR